MADRAKNTSQYRCSALLLILIASLLSVFSASAEEALWDLGLGISAVDIPHYVGSDQAHRYVLPFPYFVYRGEKLKIDRNFVHGIIFEQDDFRSEWSFSGSPPVKSDDNDARRGMPDIDAIAEVGPSLMYSLSRNDNTLWRVELPLRAAISSDFHSAQQRGFTGQLLLRFNHRWQNSQSQWLMESTIGPVYNSNSYNDYFYRVGTQYANADRTVYNSSGGNAGWRFSAGISRRNKNFWAGAFVRYVDLHDSSFADSPLVREKDSWLAGIAFAWIFHSSDKSVSEWCSNQSGGDLSETC